MIEGTDMNQIEKVARALCELHIRTVRRHDTDPEKLERMIRPAVNIAWPDFIDQAKAAIAAMPVQAEPVAWMYGRDDGSRDLLLDCNGEYARNLLELGATETPLYAHSPAPQWQGIETAPRDGTRFLAWCPYVGRVIMRIDGVHRETWAIDPLGRVGCNPTHWMPLPTPPAGGSDAE